MQRDSGGRLGEVLVSIGALSDQALAHALAAFFGFEVANLRRENIDPAVTSLLSEDVAREYSSFPVRLTNEALFIAVAEPSDDLQRILSEKSGHAVRLLIAPLSDVQWAIDSNYRAIGSVEKLVHLFESVEGRVARPSIPQPKSWSPTTRRSCRSSTASSPRRCAIVRRTCTSSHPTRSFGCASASTGRSRRSCSFRRRSDRDW